MKRRGFLAALAALPFAGCALLKPFRRNDTIAKPIRFEERAAPEYDCLKKTKSWSTSWDSDEWPSLINPYVPGRKREMPWPEPKNPYIPQHKPPHCVVVLDYEATRADSLGYVFRRTVSHPKVNENIVKSATMLENGTLMVVSYSVQQVENGLRINRWPDGDIIYNTHFLPKDEWVVKQWDGCGRLVRDITAKDYLA